jgi:hypothetical protein
VAPKTLEYIGESNKKIRPFLFSLFLFLFVSDFSKQNIRENSEEVYHIYFIQETLARSYIVLYIFNMYVFVTHRANDNLSGPKNFRIHPPNRTKKSTLFIFIVSIFICFRLFKTEYSRESFCLLFEIHNSNILETIYGIIPPYIVLYFISQ